MCVYNVYVCDICVGLCKSCMPTCESELFPNCAQTKAIQSSKAVSSHKTSGCVETLQWMTFDVNVECPPELEQLSSRAWLVPGER